MDDTVRQALAPGAPAGAYTVSWRVTSADGHPISDTFTFTARAASTATAAPSASAAGASGDAGEDEANWTQILGQSLRQPKFFISYGDAFSRRLRRNYIWMFLILLLAWVLKISTPGLQAEGAR